MAKANRNDPKDKGITKVSGDMTWLQDIEQDTSLAALQAHVIVPRLKIIQGSTEPTLKEQFGEGVVLIQPGAALVAEPGEYFGFVPLHFHTEYMKWSDRKDTESPMIVARSYDPTSDLAKRCENAELRSELYEGDEKLKDEKKKRYFRYVKAFNFVGVIYGEHPLAGTEVTLSFSRGEHGQGRNFITGCSLRRQEIATEGGGSRRVQVPLWAQVWMLKTSVRTKQTNSWNGFDFLAGEPPVIASEDASKHQGRSMELAEAFEQRRLVIDDVPEDGGETDGEDSKF